MEQVEQPEDIEARPSARKYLPALWAVNLGISAFFALLYLSMTSRMAIVEGAGASVLYTQDGGLRQAVYRYIGMSVAALIVQGVLAVLNLGVVPLLEPDDSKITPTCVKIVLASLLLIMLIAVVALAMGWPKPVA